MRHRIRKVKINRAPAHLKAMLQNLAASVVLYEKVETTETKAKAVKPLIDRLISRAKKKDTMNAIRYLNTRLTEKLASRKIMDVLVERYKKRPSGYTRIVKQGFRKGDGAPMVRIELVE